MASNLVFWFAWVSPTDKVYSSTFARNDEHVFNFSLDHEEGQIPKLSIQVINPRVGLIAPGRAYWAWLSFSPDGGTTKTPLFSDGLSASQPAFSTTSSRCNSSPAPPTTSSSGRTWPRA